MTTRTIDALCDQFVEDYAALDPVSATAFGVAGHDDRLTDLSPAGYDARIALVRAAVDAVEAATPVDDREAAARDAFLERNRLELELEAAGVAPVADVGAVERAARDPRGLRPDAHRGCGGRRQHRRPTGRRTQPLSRACG